MQASLIFSQVIWAGLVTFHSPTPSWMQPPTPSVDLLPAVGSGHGSHYHTFTSFIKWESAPLFLYFQCFSLYDILWNSAGLHQTSQLTTPNFNWYQTAVSLALLISSSRLFAYKYNKEWGKLAVKWSMHTRVPCKEIPQEYTDVNRCFNTKRDQQYTCSLLPFKYISFLALPASVYMRLCYILFYQSTADSYNQWICLQSDSGVPQTISALLQVKLLREYLQTLTKCLWK
jgi:hypothetical protein